MADGRILAEGSPAEVVPAELVEQAFRVAVWSSASRSPARPMIVPAAD